MAIDVLKRRDPGSHRTNSFAGTGVPANYIPWCRSPAISVALHFHRPATHLSEVVFFVLPKESSALGRFVSMLSTSKEFSFLFEPSSHRRLHASISIHCLPETGGSQASPSVLV